MPTQTFTTEIPQRINDKHYTIRSSKADRDYNLTFVNDRWTCDCPDARPRTEERYGGNNPNCKHRRRMLEYIREEKLRRQQEKEIETIIQEALDDKDGFSEQPQPPNIQETHRLAKSVETALYNIAPDVDQHTQQIFELEMLIDSLRKDRNQNIETIKNLTKIINQLANTVKQQQETIDGLVAAVEEIPVMDEFIQNLTSQVSDLAATVKKLQQPQTVQIHAENIRVIQSRAKEKESKNTGKRKKEPEISEDAAWEALRLSLLEVSQSA